MKKEILKNIIIIGHSGSGKSTLGKNLSNILKKKFFDSDYEIEKILKIKIKEIFKNYGESFFRKEETKFIKSLLYNKDSYILSTGAGIISLEENRKILSKLGLIIYLKSNIKECINRVIDNNNRPLINNESSLKEKINIESIFKKREILYEKISNITIETYKKDISYIIKNILYIINNN